MNQAITSPDKSCIHLSIATIQLIKIFSMIMEKIASSNVEIIYNVYLIIHTIFEKLLHSH